MSKTTAIVGGSAVAGVLAFLAANFHLEATTAVGQGILVMVGYLISAIFHVSTANGKSIARNLLNPNK